MGGGLDEEEDVGDRVQDLEDFEDEGDSRGKFFVFFKSFFL